MTARNLAHNEPSSQNGRLRQAHRLLGFSLINSLAWRKVKKPWANEKWRTSPPTGQGGRIARQDKLDGEQKRKVWFGMREPV